MYVGYLRLYLQNLENDTGTSSGGKAKAQQHLEHHAGGHSISNFTSSFLSLPGVATPPTHISIKVVIDVALVFYFVSNATPQ